MTNKLEWAKLKEAKKGNAVEGGQSWFWDEDIDSELDDKWAAAVNKLGKGNANKTGTPTKN